MVATPDGWDRRPDGTLVRQPAHPFSAAEIARRAGHPFAAGVGPVHHLPDDFHSCGYAVAYHIDGTCPTEAEAREAAGR